MDLEEFEPRQKKPKLRDLTTYSLDELREYIDTLKAEIARAEEMIKGKSAHKDAAAAFFKS